jgi:hypothetical protein
MKSIRVFENKTKVPQIYYDKNMNPHYLKPGESFTEDMSEIVNAEELRKKQHDQVKLEGEVGELKRVKSHMGYIRAAKTMEDLQRLRENEINQDLLGAILKKEKELLEKQVSD